MNYSKVLCSTKKQFDYTMNRERIIVADYFDSNITYEVFFRRNNRGANPDGKVKLYYAKETPIQIGTIFVLKGEIYIVTSKDGIESDIFFTSMAIRCDVTFVVKSNGEYKDIPLTVVSDKMTVNHGSVFNVVGGSVVMYTQDNDIARSIAINNEYYAFGGYYKVGNNFFNNGLAYFYLERQQMPQDDYKIVYNGVTSFDIKDSTTYQLSYTVTNNGNVIENPTIHYSSSDETIATVDSNGLMTMLKEGTVDITASYSTASVTTTMTIANSSTPSLDYTMEIYAASDELKVGGSYKGLEVKYYNSEGTDITTETIANKTREDYVWSAWCEGVDLTNDTSFVKWVNGSTVNQKRIKLLDDRSYLTKTMTIKCETDGITISKDFRMVGA